jgi:predicted phage terminase large subunit-like protein
MYLLQVYRQRLEYPQLKRAVVQQAEAYGATVVLIEDKASGTQLVQDLRAEGHQIVQGCKPENDKIMRMHAQTAMIEGGFVFLPSQAPWLPQYLHELTTFPNSKYDDQADSTSQAIAWVNATPVDWVTIMHRTDIARGGFLRDALYRRLRPRSMSLSQRSNNGLRTMPARTASSHGGLR